MIEVARDPRVYYECVHLISYAHELRALALGRASISGGPRWRTFVETTRMLQVACPKCDAEPLMWCRHPDGQPHQVLHASRWERSRGVTSFEVPKEVK